LEGVSNPASHPDFDWFEPETFTPAAGSGFANTSYRVFSLNGAFLEGGTELVSISTDGVSERNGSWVALTGVMVGTGPALKAIAYPLKAATPSDFTLYIGIPTKFPLKTKGITLNLKAEVKTKDKGQQVILLTLNLTPGGGNPGI